MTTILYAHYGVLDYPGETIYTARGYLPRETFCEAVRVEFPDEYPLSSNRWGDVEIDLGLDGRYPLQDVLYSVNDKPVLCWQSADRHIHQIPLKVLVEEY